MTPSQKSQRNEMIKKHKQFMIDKDSKKTKLSKKSKAKKKVKKLANREILLKHFRLHESTSNVGICHCISKEMGISVPGERFLYKKVMRDAVKIILKIGKVKQYVRKPTPSEKFFSSKQWKELRYLALKQSGGCCQLCGATAADGVQIHVDHIKPRSRYPSLEYDLDNLQTMCADCNIGKSNIDDTNWRQHWESI